MSVDPDIFQMIDRVFDIMNSRNLRAGGFKAPLGNLDWCEKLDFLSRARKYLVDLVMQDGKPLHQSKRFLKIQTASSSQDAVLHRVHKMLFCIEFRPHNTLFRMGFIQFSQCCLKVLISYNQSICLLRHLSVMGLVINIDTQEDQQYVLIYRFSQEHLELLFNSIRASGLIYIL